MLSACVGGPGWAATVLRWTELECAYSFKTGIKPIATTGRPNAVHVWMKSSRPPNKPPTLELNAFMKDWWTWWCALSPAWRVKGTEGRPVVGKHGPWGVLVHPGANGIRSY
ncbi:hypothetical protein C8R44DRAFT_602789 [Mycena epipterygia]|nr:hypothetical protein C8R44DRAFT_602789 [Mycena epipterygia]